MKKQLFILVILSLLSFSVNSKVIMSGIRTSRYGIEPFPTAPQWHNAIYTMNKNFTGSKQTAIWTAGDFWDPDICHLYFPGDASEYENIEFEDEDYNEEYLDYFDSVGIDIFLQIEPGNADVITVMDLVMEQYGHHECIIGFGVDVEWYQCADYEWGKKVTDQEAKEWENALKAYNPNYKLFLKHPARDPQYFPDNYRGDIIFVNDCEGKETFAGPKGFTDYENDFLGTMKTFADAFYPNQVIYQIGYPSISKLWENFSNKPKKLGEDLDNISKQDIGVFWVDFGIKGVLPLDSISLSVNNFKNIVFKNQFVTDKNMNVINLLGRSLEFVPQNRRASGIILYKLPYQHTVKKDIYLR